MQALFIGQTYIDVTLVADRIPTGDDKDVARDYAVSFGGNAVTAAFCCARLGIAPDLLTIARRRLARAACSSTWRPSIRCRCMAGKSQRSSLSFVIPKGDKRAILRARDDHYLHPFPPLNLAGCRALHLDGHHGGCRDPLRQGSAARRASSPRSTAAACASTRWTCSSFIDVAVVSERFCEQLQHVVRRASSIF